MPTNCCERQGPANHVFVDYENVHEIDHTIIGGKSVIFTLLMGPRQTKLDASLVEKLLENAGSVQLVRIASSGKNALDFALAYYIGRAVASDPTGHFHIISKDSGYDPLISHLASKYIRVRRHESFGSLNFGGTTTSNPPAPAAATAKIISPLKPKALAPILTDRAAQVLERLRKPKATRPKTQPRLVRHLVALLGQKISEAEALGIIEDLQQTNNLTIGENGTVSYKIK